MAGLYGSPGVPSAVIDYTASSDADMGGPAF